MKTNKAVAVKVAGSGLTADEMAVIRDAREQTSGRDFDTAFEAFKTALIIKTNATYATTFDGRPSIIGRTYTFEDGKRYIRVWARMTTNGVDSEGSGRGSAYAFVDKLTGDVLKPATWKGPAKGARCNIFDADPVSACGQYGMARNA